MPPKNESGTLITSAQGQETTRKVRPRKIQSAQVPVRRPPPTASSAAAPVTAGV